MILCIPVLNTNEKWLSWSDCLMSYLLRFIKQIESFRAVTEFTFQNLPKIMTISQQHFVEYINNGVLKKTDILQMFKNYII